MGDAVQLDVDTTRQHSLIMLGLTVAVAGLIAASLLAFAAWDNQLAYSGMAMLLFDLDTEQNIPTWFSTILLAYLAVAGWKLMPHRAGGITKLAYVGLGAGFLFLSADEAALLHERIGGTVELDGALNHARWIVIWLPVLGLCGLVLLAVLWKSSPRLTLGLAVGAFVYLSGAIGVEMVNQVSRHGEEQRLEAAGIAPADLPQFSPTETRFGKDTLAYAAGTALEEGLEKSGILIWCAVILAAHRRLDAESPSTRTEAHAEARTLEAKPPARAATPAAAEQRELASSEL